MIISDDRCQIISIAESAASENLTGFAFADLDSFLQTGTFYTTFFKRNYVKNSCLILNSFLDSPLFFYHPDAFAVHLQVQATT